MIKRSKKRDKEGVLTLVDALLFIFVLLIVSIFVFSFLQTAFFQTSDIKRSKFRREAVVDIQEAALHSVIDETEYINRSSESNRVVYRNITVETAILNYIYLSESEREDENLSYDLSRLEEDIEKRYEECVWEISHYNFAVKTDHGSTDLFISNIEEVTTAEGLPSEKSATSSFATLGLERVQITLYIWR